MLLLFIGSFGVVVYRMQDTNFVVDRARSVNLYSRLATNITPLIAGDESITKDIGLTSLETPELIKGAIDGEQFYDFLHQYLDAYIPWITGKTDKLDFTYDLSPTKDKLTDSLATKILAQYDALSVCTSAQLRNWEFKETLPTCKLASTSSSSKDISAQALLLASNFSSVLPDQIIAPAPSEKLVGIQKMVTIGFKVIYSIWALTLIFILLYLLVFRSKGLVNLGVIFIFVGLLHIGFSFIGWDWITRTVSDAISGGDAKSLIPIMIDFVTLILESLKSALSNLSIGLLGAGVMMLLVGIFSRFKKAVPIAK